MSQSAPAKASGGLAPRLITAAIGVPILLWAILWASTAVWFSVVFAAVVVGLFEYYGMTMGPDERALGAVGIVLGALVVPLIYYAPDGAYVLYGLVVVVMAMLAAVLFSASKMDRAAYLIGTGVTGIFYVAFLLAFLTLLRRDPGEDGRYWILLLLVVTWLGDTGAYFAGRAFGRHKLAPTVSPKKTWEGAIGGVAASVGGAFVAVALMPLSLHPFAVASLAAPAAVLGQIGDLCESLLKRSVGAKDSGTIIYGHGGILDRIDALIFTAPYFYLFYRLSGMVRP